jgi:hypothetical protein
MSMTGTVSSQSLFSPLSDSQSSLSRSRTQSQPTLASLNYSYQDVNGQNKTFSIIHHRAKVLDRSTTLGHSSLPNQSVLKH